VAQGPTVEFSDVFVVRETETALLCRIGAKFHWVAHGRLQPGSKWSTQATSECWCSRGTSPLNFGTVP
jgi:hypothetical protein